MTRATRTLSAFAIVSLLYLPLYLGLLPLPTLIQTQIIPYLPFWAIISFGTYLLANLAYGVLTLNNKEEEYLALKKEIEVAKWELREWGVDVD